jgi:hypothetical protein
MKNRMVKMTATLTAVLTLCPSCFRLVRILCLSKFIAVFPLSRELLQFNFVRFANVDNSFLSSRLCEVKAFTGSVDSLRTPFKDSCENMSKSEIGYVSINLFVGFFVG